MHNLLAENMSKTILKRVADDSGSLITKTYSKDSRLATPCNSPDNSVLDDTEFEFDHKVINTQVYRRAFINARRRDVSAVQEVTSNTTSPNVPVTRAFVTEHPAIANEHQLTRTKTASLNRYEEPQVLPQSLPNVRTSRSTQTDRDGGMTLIPFDDLSTNTSKQTLFASKSLSSRIGYSCIINTEKSLLNRKQFGSIVVKDQCYFTRQSQQLFQEIQSWARRFSNFSYLRPCYFATASNDPMPFSIYRVPLLNSSEVDSYLANQSKRQNVFISWLSTTLWRYIFSRYLFGLKKEQRQQLRTVERLLANTGEL